MTPQHRYLLTLNTGIIEVIFIRYTVGGWLDCVVNGDPCTFNPATVIATQEL